MPLTLRYRGQTSIPVEVEGITPDAVQALKLAEIERLPIFHGNQKLTLADFFQVTGDAADGAMRWEGDLAGVHWIGAGMQSGTIHVEGHAGRHVGSEMTKGEIHVHGNASDWVGGEMHGGLIHVRGSAGHLIGAAYRGSRKGMSGGTILIQGDAGNEVGHTMRRGLIAVGGSLADFVGVNMIAGTVLVFGGCGIRPGAGMRRGTIGIFSEPSPQLLPTFKQGASYRPLFLKLLLKQLRKLDFTFDPKLLEADYTFHHGDLVTVGKGEILFAARAG